jgi:DNA-binding transcriptional LysR family regulator
MEAGEIDLLIGAERLMPAAASAQPIFKERFVFIQRPGHPRGTAPITLDEFCALDHILVSPDGGGFIGATDLALARQGRTRNVRTSLSSFMLIPPLIQDSNLVAVIPARLAASWSHLVEAYAPPLDIPNFTVCMSWHPRRQNDPAHLWLRNQVASLA